MNFMLPCQYNNQANALCVLWLVQLAVSHLPLPLTLGPLQGRPWLPADLEPSL